MKDFFWCLICTLYSTLIFSQEGFWSIDQWNSVQNKLDSAGLHFSKTQISNSEAGGLAQAVIRFHYGTATFVNARGLAIGVLSPSVVPDSLWYKMKDGVWLAKAGQGIPLDGLDAHVFMGSVPVSDPLATPGSTRYEPSKSLEIHAADAQQKVLYEQRYQKLGKMTLVGAIRLPPQDDVEYQVGVLLQVQLPEGSKSFAFIPHGSSDTLSGAHLVVGFPESSSIHRSGFELEYARDLSKHHQDLDRALGAYLTRTPFITQEGVFRMYENVQLLEQVLPKRALLEAEFRHQLSINPELKARYGTLLDSCRAAFKDLRRYAAAQVYTKGIIYSPCSFFEAVRLFTMWRGRAGTSAHRLPTAEEGQYFPEVFKRLPPTENELLLPELLQRYFTQIPSEHLAPYAIQQAVYANKDYGQMSETLLLKSKFTEPETISKLLEKDFLQNIDLIANDPAVQLVDSILQFYAEKVVPKMELARRKAFQKSKELVQAMSEVLPNYPAYPDADQSLRISYGTQLEAWDENPLSFWLSNAHVLEGQLGSPMINAKGELLGMVRDLHGAAQGNAYFYDAEKSRAVIWRIDSIRQRIAAHPNGMYILKEWP